MQILGDVMAAVAGADDERAFAAPRLAVGVGARMHYRAAEVGEGGKLRHVWNAADTGSEHHMPRLQAALSAVGTLQADRPALRKLVGAPAEQFGASPVVELECLDVGLEPAREHEIGRA